MELFLTHSPVDRQPEDTDVDTIYKLPFVNLLV